MRRLTPLPRLLLIAGLLAAVGAPGVRAGGGPAPGESCVPGTVWEDPASGVKYLCVYDELYGGTRWELLSSGQRGATAWLYRSSSLGCLRGQTGLASAGGGGAAAIARSYRWPCQRAAERSTQPAGELRARTVLQVYDGGWRTCRDTGYVVNTSAASGWLAGIDMGGAPDCGAGTYRAIGYGSMFQGGAWRTGSVVTPSLALR